MSAVDPLTRLAIRHGTDKFGGHFYTPIYHQLFAPLRERPVRLLEIGVGGYGWRTVGGASLAMWADYFPLGQVVGFDVEDKRLDLGPRVTVRQGSQDDPAFLERLCDELGPFDVILDDGSHLPAHVVASFDALFPRLADPGLYVIEDTQTAFWPRFGGSPTDGGDTMRLASRLLREINHAEIDAAEPGRRTPPPSGRGRQLRSLRAFHNLLVIEKGDNTEPSNFACRPDDPHLAGALRTIEEELARAPTPAGCANLAVVLLLSGARERAAEVLRGALERWPDHPASLMIAIDVFVDPEERLRMVDALARIEGEPSRALVERVRAAVREGQPAMWVSATRG